MLEVLTAAESNDLTTMDAVVTELGTLTSAQKSWVAFQITAASALIEQAANQHFAQQQFKETIEGSGSSTLMLSRTPIIGTPTILSTNNDVIADFVVEDAEAGILYRQQGWTRMVSYWPDTITHERLGFESHPSFVITYNAGYHLPSFPDAAANGEIPLPANIERACIVTIKDWWHKKNRDGSVSWKQVGDLALGYRGDTTKDTGVLELPPEARGLIKQRIF